MPLPLLITCHNFTEHVLRQKPTKPSRLKPRLPPPARHPPCSRVHHPFLGRELRAEAGRVPAGSEAAGVCTDDAKIPGLADSRSLTAHSRAAGEGPGCASLWALSKESDSSAPGSLRQGPGAEKRVGRHEHADSKKWFGLPILKMQRE